MAGTSMRMKVKTYNGSLLDVEDFVKKELYRHDISIQKAADVCDLKEFSFRNKMSRHALDIKDITALLEKIGYQLAIVNPNADCKCNYPVVFKFNADLYRDRDGYIKRMESVCDMAIEQIDSMEYDPEVVTHKDSKNYEVYISKFGYKYILIGENTFNALSFLNGNRDDIESENMERLILKLISKEFNVEIERVSDALLQLIKTNKSQI